MSQDPYLNAQMKEDAPARQPTRRAQISNFSLQLQPTLTEMTHSHSGCKMFYTTFPTQEQTLHASSKRSGESPDTTFYSKST